MATTYIGNTRQMGIYHYLQWHSGYYGWDTPNIWNQTLVSNWATYQYYFYGADNNNFYLDKAGSAFRLIPSATEQAAYFSAELSFTAPGSYRIYVLSADWQTYNFTTVQSNPVVASGSAGAQTIIIPDVYLGNAGKYGLAIIPESETGNIKSFGITATVSYTDSGLPPDTSGVSPAKSTSILANENTKFTWTYRHITNVPMVSWELHIIRDDVDSTIMSGSGAAYGCTVPAGTLSSGIVEWYVRVGGSEGGEVLYGTSDPIKIVIRINPDTSDVSCDGKPRPTITWTAVEQQAAEIRFNGKEYPIAFTDGGSYTLPEIYADGVYPVQVRTQTTSGDWSQWTETIYVQITNVEPTSDLALDYTIDGTTVTLTWTSSASGICVLYRDGVPIYAGTDTSYTDLRVCGTAVYTVRQITDAYYYAEVILSPITIIPASDMLLLPGDPLEIFAVRQHPNMQPRSFDVSAEIDMRYYAGRALPVAVTEGHKSETVSVSAFFRSSAEARALESLTGKTVIYKTRKGDSVYGVVTGSGRTGGVAETVNIRITATDADERAYL